ncbi:oligosaccharide flippase family protein [Deinococcus sp. JMULE3]|uniref:oligosaccharide flippase family protein n=1 Tax=Deinococcus sp. JMULE3 TaxID=2518341 RepID=UPI0015761624|nr:oligosaccharide flippase family protein [Deinococcus sp. JMULE3]NTY01079.1 hypothetical protein [Deinococcus sp. JMULE3]
MTIISKIALLSSGSIVSQLIPLAFTPLLTRVYSPEDFGLFAIYFSASSLIAVGGSLKYEQGIILSNNRAEISGFYYTSLLIGLASSIIVSGLFYLIPNRWVSTPYDFLVLLLFCASSIFIQSLTLLTLKLEATRDLAISKIVLTTTTVAFQFLIAVKFITMTGSGLILGAIVGNLACILFLLKVTSGKLHPLKSNGDHIRIMETIKSRTEYPLKILPAALLNSASTQIPVLGFASLFGTHFAGQFGLANRVMNIPSAFIGSSIGQIYLQQISKINRIQIISSNSHESSQSSYLL